MQIMAISELTDEERSRIDELLDGAADRRTAFVLFACDKQGVGTLVSNLQREQVREFVRIMTVQSSPGVH